ncbi:MAG: cobalt-precorrin 5A hydrolase, partial [Oscillospiraceae bacterium]
SDPAVIVIDDCGKFAIPILSGHIGGANQLAEYIADNIGAAPVITTATDSGGRFSPDSFASANGLIITDINVAKAIAAAVLDGEVIGLCSEYHCENIPSELIQDESCRIGIYIGTDISKKPFETTLCLVPRNICIGIGCKQGTSLANIEAMVFNALQEEKISSERICSVVSIDIKADESGLLQFCDKYKLNFHMFSAQELMSVTGDFHRSDFVLSKTGTDNVCERSAAKCGEIIMHRKAANGITVAAAEIPMEIDFEKRIL